MNYNSYFLDVYDTLFFDQKLFGCTVLSILILSIYYNQTMLSNSPKKIGSVLQFERNDFLRYSKDIKYYCSLLQGYPIKEAKKEFAKIIEQKNIEEDTKKNYKVKLANIEYLSKKLTKAEKFFDKVIADERFCTGYKQSAWLNKGFISMMESKFSRAEKCFRENIKCNNNTQQGYPTLFEALIGQKKFQETIRQIKNYLKLFPGVEWAQKELKILQQCIKGKDQKLLQSIIKQQQQQEARIIHEQVMAELKFIEEQLMNKLMNQNQGSSSDQDKKIPLKKQTSDAETIKEVQQNCFYHPDYQKWIRCKRTL